MDICKFLNNSYTSYHAVDNVCSILKEHNFIQLSLGDNWNLSVGGSYYVTQNGSSIVAFKVGANKAFNICESHTDSPSFKVKGTSLLPSAGLSRINTEKYGGGLCYSFFDRQLKICGRLLVQTENGVEQQLVASKYNVVIPSLAVHHNPTVNEGFAVNLQNDTLPLFAQDQTNLYSSLTDKKVVDADLYAVPATEAFYAGANNEFLCSARLDDLTNVYTSIHALCSASPKNIAVVACLDNEEIGSATRHGGPEFLRTVLRQIESSLHMSVEEIVSARENGMVLSVDNGHALHPAHPEKSDPQMYAQMNAGVVVKHHPNYATDALTSAIFKSVMQKAQLPVQDYYNRSDVRCGSTLGLATSRVLQMKTCDIGLAQLAMHSSCETLGVHDIATMQQALQAFLGCKITVKGNKIDID